MSAVIKQIVRGYNQMPVLSEFSVALPVDLDPTKTVLFFNTWASGDATSDAFVMGTIQGSLGSAQVFFDRGSSSSDPCWVSWEAVEFFTGVNVQRGTLNSSAINNLVSGFYETNLSISSVNLSRSFCTVSHFTSDTSLGSSEFFWSKITSSTNLKLRIATTRSGSSDVSWQVVEFTGSEEVRSADFILNSGSTSVSAILPSFDASRSFVVFSNLVDPPAIYSARDAYATASVNSNTQVVLTREGTSATLRGTVYVIQLAPPSSVHNFSLSITSSNSASYAQANSLENTFVSIAGAYGFSGSSNNSSTTGDGANYAHVAVSSRDNSQLIFTRGFSGSSTTNINAALVSFPLFVSSARPLIPASYSDYMMF